MKCTVTNFSKVERENALPYYVLKARGVEGDANASMIGEDGLINPFACMSRVFNFTKTLFPGTENQCEALEKAFTCNEDGTVSNGPQIALFAATWATPQPFYIRKADSVTGFYEDEAEVTEKIGGKEVIKTKYTPRVFNQINLTLFGNSAEDCPEGKPDDLCRASWERGIARQIYCPCETTEIEPVIA